MLGGFPLLTWLVFLPIVAAVVCLLVPPAVSRPLALAASLVTLAGATVLLFAFPPGATGLQMDERQAWIPALGIGYRLGLDGLNVTLVALTALLAPIAILTSWDRPARAIESAGDRGEGRHDRGARPRLFVALILLLEGTVIGALTALDLILYFVFWEAMLIPMYLLIGSFGGARRGFTALKFFIYTSVGSLLMFLAILALSFFRSNRIATRTPSFDLFDLVGTSLVLSPWEQRFLFLAFALAFAIKLPLFPLHSWLADAYSQAPTTVLVLATMLVKVGAYSFLRFGLPLFPDAAREIFPILAILATIGIIYGGLVAAAQRDMVRLLAFSSLAHLGFIALGIFALDSRALQGSLLQMVNHGVSSGALFLIVAMIARRTGTRDLASLGGLARRWPVLSGCFVLAAFSSLGLPGLNGFVGEFLILLGAFRTQRVLAVIATFGVVLAAIYMLRLFRGTMFGREQLPAVAAASSEAGEGGDLSPRELAALAPLLVMIIWLAWYPSPFLRRTEGAVTALLAVPALAQSAVSEGDMPRGAGNCGGAGAIAATTIGSRDSERAVTEGIACESAARGEGGR